ncbi:MAG: NADH-quinone oxidoreductase subunit NuoF [Armatimonadota bacterium]|nr:NADH-quinone oxidoreductase subunit NuoF [Armatimonadota bacterium]MDR7403719.1 NADH-quinone oxidoreductase subunit NuoF [Armatimonadota bacterium]
MNAPSEQPPTLSVLSDRARAQIRRLAERFPHRQSALLGALFVAQEEVGYLSPQALADVAEVLDLPYTEVASVASFYHLYHLRPVGRHLIQVCTNISCLLSGCDRVVDRMRRRLGVEVGQTTADGMFTLRAAECLAACDRAPALMVDDDLHGPVAPSTVDRILAAYASGTPPAAAAADPSAAGLQPAVSGGPAAPTADPGLRQPEGGPVLLRYVHDPDQADLEVYRSRGGYEGLRRALAMPPEAVIEEVERSGLRGRGGAGFPTGRKWKFLPRDPAVTKYVVVNADEGEPGTFKDRTLLEGDPHRLVEGALIAAYAVGARQAFIYLRREFARARARLERALAQAADAGLVGRNILGSGVDVEVVLATGAGAYIAGEETALLESLEGRRALPRLKPPYYPAVKGLYGQPTALNNVETLCHVAWILARGADWYRQQGPPILVSVSGHVARPGVYEIPLGTTIRQVIERAGGMREGRAFKACFPGGSSSAILPAAYLDTPMDYDALARLDVYGAMLGSGALIVMDETTCMVEVVARTVEFYRDESCGKCTPCREGTVWLSQVLGRILAGGGRPADLDLLEGIARGMTGTCFCPLGESVPPAIYAALRFFRHEFEHHIARGRCDVRAPVPAS